MPGMHSTVAKPTGTHTDQNELWEEKANPDLATQQKMLQTITFKLGNFDDENRTFQAIGSTPLVDRQGDTIEQDGWVLGAFIKNPVIPWAHCYSELPVARAIEVGVVNGNLVFTYQAPPEGLYPFADTVWNMYRHQFMFAFSVGFMPIEYDGNWEDGYNFTKCELLEISAVPVPANAGALVLAQKMGVMDNKEAQSMINKVEAALKTLKEANNVDVRKELPAQDKTTVVEETTEVTEKLGDAETTKKTTKKTETPVKPVEADKEEVEAINKDENVQVTIVDRDSLKSMLAEILKELNEVQDAINDEETIKELEEAEASNISNDSKDLTNEDNMVQNDNMTEQKAGAKISADTKAKIKAVMDGLKDVQDAIGEHHKALSDLYNVGADSGESSATNDDPDADNDNDGKDKSIDKDSKVEKTNEVVAEAKAADDESEESAEQEGEESKEAEATEEASTDESVDNTEEAAEESTEEAEEAPAEEAKEETSEESEVEAPAEEAAETSEEESSEEEAVETEKSAKSEDEDLIDPDNLSDEDIVKLTAAVQAELDKENN